MKKILFVATVKQHILAFHIPFLKMLKEMGYATAVAACNDHDNKNECDIPYCDEYFDVSFERSPFSFANIKAYRQLKKIISNNRYDIIHCHTPVGGVLARLAAWGSGAKVVYTCHGFQFHKKGILRDWILFFPVEWVCAWLTDVLITINQEDHALAKKYMHAKQICYIQGIGVDLGKFNVQKLTDEQKNTKRQALGLVTGDTMLLSIGELTPRKNHEIVIKALTKIGNDKVKYFIAGQGQLKEYLNNLIIDLHLENSVFLLGFRKDIVDLCNVADIGIFPSKTEGLGLAGIEMMASGLPLISSNVHGILDYSIDGKTGYTCNPYSAEEFAEAIKKLVENKRIRDEMGYLCIEQVKPFAIENSLKAMKKIYEEVL